MKWTPTRIEEFLSATHGRDVETHAELALDANGKVLAYRIRTLANVGAYAGTIGIIIQLLIGPWVSTSIYDIRTIDFDFQAVLTNTAPTAAYRGAGRPEAIYLIERLFDAAARQLGLDPAEIRRRNLIQPEQMPYTNAMGQVYDSGKFGSILEQALTLAKWDDFAVRAGGSRRRAASCAGAAWRRSWNGPAAMCSRSGSPSRCPATARSRFTPRRCRWGRGSRPRTRSSSSMSSACEIERIRIVMGDTDRGQGFGSAGSRSLFTAGSAINHASETAVANGRDLAAEALEAAAADIEYAEGMFRIAGTDRGIGLFELAARQPERRIYVDATSKVNGPSWPNGAHIARSRSIRTPARSRSFPMCRPTMSAGWSIR